MLDSASEHLNWLRVAEHMPEFTLLDVEGFKRASLRPNGSPTQEMLDAWASYNHTVGELVDILKEVGHTQAVDAILGKCSPWFWTGSEQKSPVSEKEAPFVQAESDHLHALTSL